MIDNLKKIMVIIIVIITIGLVWLTTGAYTYFTTNLFEFNFFLMFLILIGTIFVGYLLYGFIFRRILKGSNKKRRKENE